MTDIIHSESKLIKYHTCYEPGISTIEQTAAFNHFSKNKLPQSSKNQQSVIMIHSHKLQDGIFMDFPKLDQVVTPYHLKTSNLSRAGRVMPAGDRRILQHLQMEKPHIEHTQNNTINGRMIQR